MTHFHHCPHCYEAFECSGRCTIEPDLADRGRDFGSHAVCCNIKCLIRAAADKYGERFEARCREALHRLRDSRDSSGCPNCGDSGVDIMADGSSRPCHCRFEALHA